MYRCVDSYRYLKFAKSDSGLGIGGRRAHDGAIRDERCHMAKTRLTAFAAAALLVVGLAACTAPEEDAAPLPTTPVVQLGAPGEANRTLSPEEAAGLDSPTYVEADV